MSGFRCFHPTNHKPGEACDTDTHGKVSFDFCPLTKVCFPMNRTKILCWFSCIVRISQPFQLSFISLLSLLTCVLLNLLQRCIQTDDVYIGQLEWIGT